MFILWGIVASICKEPMQILYTTADAIVVKGHESIAKDSDYRHNTEDGE